MSYLAAAKGDWALLIPESFELVDAAEVGDVIMAGNGLRGRK